MWELDAFNYSTSAPNRFTIYDNADELEVQSYAGRSVIGLTASSTGAAAVYVEWACWYPFPSLTASTDAYKYGIHARHSFYIDTNSFENSMDGEYLGNIVLVNNQGVPSNEIYIYPRLEFDGTDTHLKVYAYRYPQEEPNSIDLGAVSIDTLYQIDYRLYSDCCKISLNGGTEQTLDYIEAGVWYLWQFCIQWPIRTKVDVHLVSYSLTFEEFDFPNTVGHVLYNGKVADGEMIFIEETALEAALLAGDAYAYTVTDGSFTEACANDTDYVEIFVREGNSGGYARKLNKSSGDAWTESDFTI